MPGFFGIFGVASSASPDSGEPATTETPSFSNVLRERQNALRERQQRRLTKIKGMKEEDAFQSFVSSLRRAKALGVDLDDFGAFALQDVYTEADVRPVWEGLSAEEKLSVTLNLADGLLINAQARAHFMAAVSAARTRSANSSRTFDGTTLRDYSSTNPRPAGRTSTGESQNPASSPPPPSGIFGSLFGRNPFASSSSSANPSSAPLTAAASSPPRRLLNLTAAASSPPARLPNLTAAASSPPARLPNPLVLSGLGSRTAASTTSSAVGTTSTLFASRNAPTSSIFGGASANRDAPTTSIFGGPSANRDAPTTSIFGGAPANRDAPTTSIFGGAYANRDVPTTSIFDGDYANRDAPTTSIFGGAYANRGAPATSIFDGAYANRDVPPTSLFSTPAADNEQGAGAASSSENERNEPAGEDAGFWSRGRAMLDKVAEAASSMFADTTASESESQAAGATASARASESEAQAAGATTASASAPPENVPQATGATTQVRTSNDSGRLFNTSFSPTTLIHLAIEMEADGQTSTQPSGSSSSTDRNPNYVYGDALPDSTPIFMGYGTLPDYSSSRAPASRSNTLPEIRSWPRPPANNRMPFQGRAYTLNSSDQ